MIWWVVGKAYRPWTPTQGLMFPPSPSDWLPDDHLVYFLLDLVEELDLSEIHRKYQEKDPRGMRPYDPRMMALPSRTGPGERGQRRW